MAERAAAVGASRALGLAGEFEQQPAPARAGEQPVRGEGASSRLHCPTLGWAGFTGGGEIVLHGDFGPWNLVWRGTRPIGIIDWDYAWPGRPIHDVAYALEYVAPFRDDELCRRWLAYPDVPDRRRRLELFAEAYGLESSSGLVDEVLAQQQAVWERARRLAAQGMQPQAEWQQTGFLDTTADRLRWTRDNRALFE